MPFAGTFSGLAHLYNRLAEKFDNLSEEKS